MRDVYQLLYIHSSTSWWLAVSLLETCRVNYWNKLKVNSASCWFLLYGSKCGYIWTPFVAALCLSVIHISILEELSQFPVAPLRSTGTGPSRSCIITLLQAIALTSLQVFLLLQLPLLCSSTLHSQPSTLHASCPTAVVIFCATRAAVNNTVHKMRKCAASAAASLDDLNELNMCILSHMHWRKSVQKLCQSLLMWMCPMLSFNKV
jgi:hypothetical protein